jgi:hypothetical protein
MTRTATVKFPFVLGSEWEFSDIDKSVGRASAEET